MSSPELALLARIGVGFALAYLLGFERQVRGSPAGDRTFALVGAASAAITAVAAGRSPQTIAGVVTGIGFIGGGVVFHRGGGSITGVTTAATIFAAAGVGIVVGFGHLILGAITSLGVLLTLELPHIPGLRRLDAHSLSGRFAKDPIWRDPEQVSPSPVPDSPPAGSDGPAAGPEAGA
jgi:putative Mg2+ transporter-C (MgtC) family protein